MDDLFDAVGGLPLHVLVVHGLVVGIPLMALVTVATAWLRPLRQKASWVVVVANAGLLGLSWVATQSGEKLQDRRESLTGGEIESIELHEDRGELVPYAVLMLLAVSVLVALTRRRQSLRLPSTILAALVAVIVVGWTVLVGHSGSESVWGDLVRSTNP